jgi:serine/threonine-protein kinase
VDIQVASDIRTATIPTGIVGASLREAEAELRRAEVRFVPPIFEYSDVIPAGTVIAISHEEGGSIPYYTLLSMTVSRGPAAVTVSQQVGRSEQAAISALAALGLNGIVSAQEPSAEIAAGHVISQYPISGTTMKRGDSVTLTISSGPGN